MAQRYQKEIEEILDQANAQAVGGKAASRSGVTKRPPRRMPAPQAGASRLSPRFSIRFSPGWIVILGIVLLLAAWILRIVQLFPGMVGPLAWGGVILFIIAYIRYFSGPRRTVERRWRQRSIEDDSDASGRGSFWKRFWR